jgi:hypothetical protein
VEQSFKGSPFSPRDHLAVHSLSAPQTKAFFKMSLGWRHDHDVMGGMTTTSVDVPSLFYKQQIFWVFIRTVIGIPTLANILNQIIYRQWIASWKTQDAAKPRLLFFKMRASMSAIIREYGYHFKPLSIRKMNLYLPQPGQPLWPTLYS